MPKGWASNPVARYVHGLTTGFYFLQYRYHCRKCKSTMYSGDLFFDDFLRSMLPVYLMNDSALHLDVVELITKAATGTTSFSNVVSIIADMRLSEYPKLRWQYNEVKSQYSKSIRSAVSDVLCPEFSSFNDTDGYNECHGPSQGLLTTVFEEYMSDRKGIIQKLSCSIPVHPVISFDHTFKIGKRTTKLSVSRKYKLAIKENSFFIIMGANGTVLSFCRAVETRGDFVERQLKDLKKRCADTGQKYPSYVCTDDCCATRPLVHRIFTEEPKPKVVQDVRHLIERLLRECCTESKLYGPFKEELTAAIMGPKVTVFNRTNEPCGVPSRLGAPKDIEANIMLVIPYRRLHS